MTAAAVLNGSENCLPIGTRLSDFEITGILGEGGFGIVYIAFDHSLQRSVAIKEYMPGALAARAADHSVAVRAERHQDTFNVGLKSFINEARFLAQFDHPSLVKVYRFWEQNRTAYTAMQYYDGRTIKDIVADSPELVNEAWCRRVMTQILEALEMLYTMQILHRDVSPDNIIVQDNGDAVLLDFGSARQIIGDMTRGLTVILKPGYAPVEQYAGDASLEQGAFTDIYALSAVIWFAILKEAPPTSIARMIKDPIMPLQEQRPEGYSTGFLAALDKGLAVLSQDRPQTIDEFRALLGIASAGAPRARPAGATQRFATLAQAPAAAPVAAAPQASAAAPARPAVPRSMLGALAGGVLLGAAILYPLVSGPSVTAIEEAAPRTAAPPSAPAPAPLPGPAAPEPDAEALAWDKLKNAQDATREQLAAFIRQYPDGRYGAPAKTRLAELTAAPVVEAPAPEPLPETASYRLAVKPWGTVYVDGKERGVTPPMKKLTLAAGKHNIRVANPGFPDYVTEIDVRKNKAGTIEHDFSTPPK
jgi:predicted Ser/Thr protein kinase